MITFDDVLVNPFVFKDTVTVPAGTVFFGLSDDETITQLTSEATVIVVNSALPGAVEEYSVVVQSEDEVDRRSNGIGYDVSVFRVSKVVFNVTFPFIITYDDKTGKETAYVVTEALLAANNKPVEYAAPILNS
jgi:hypothetical protein